MLFHNWGFVYTVNELKQKNTNFKDLFFQARPDNVFKNEKKETEKRHKRKTKCIFY